MRTRAKDTALDWAYTLTRLLALAVISISERRGK